MSYKDHQRTSPAMSLLCPHRKVASLLSVALLFVHLISLLLKVAYRIQLTYVLFHLEDLDVTGFVNSK